MTNPGKPQHIKLINEALIREALAARGEATTADLVSDTGLSQTTVSQVLEQLRQSGIVKDSGKRASSGGRRASAWILDPKAWSSVGIAVEADCLSWGIANALGSLTSQGRRVVRDEPLRDALALAEELKAAADEGQSSGGKSRTAAAIGVPGAVKGGRVITGDYREDWGDTNLEALFAERLGLPIVVENDLNAIALGYLKSAETSGYKLHSLVYIHFNGGSCVGSGIVVEGQVLRGASSFSGEIGYLPVGGDRILDDLMAEAEEGGNYVGAIVTALRAVNCIVNPALIVVGGKGFRFDLGDDVRARFNAMVEQAIRPSLVFVPDSYPHYLDGLVSLAAERVFPGYRLIQRSGNS
jgi:DNA-binding transcriptional ArsR family regulator